MQWRYMMMVMFRGMWIAKTGTSEGEKDCSEDGGREATTRTRGTTRADGDDEN